MMEEEKYLNLIKSIREKNWPSCLPKEAKYPFGKVPLTKYLEKWAQLTPQKPCLIFYGTEITFKQLNDMTDCFASYLKSTGLKKGDRVGVFLPNCPQYHIVFYGVLKMGCILVPINPMYKSQELLYVIQDTDPKVIVSLDTLYPTIESIKDQIQVDEIITTSFQDVLPEEPTINLHKYLLHPKQKYESTRDLMQLLAEQPVTKDMQEVNLDDVVILNYSSGTTGFPKGCAHTQRNMLYTAANLATFNLDITTDDLGLVYLPIFWIAGENNGVLTPIFSGTTHVLLARWDPVAFLQAIDRYKPTFTGGTLDNFIQLMEHPDINKYQLKSLKSTSVASFVKNITPKIRDHWYELTGSYLRESAYGLTETHTMDTFTTGLQENNMDLNTRFIFCGLPAPGTEFKIVDFDTGKLKGLGEEGEIVIRTPSFFKYYWNNEDETQKAFQDGWFHTGDIGVIDQAGMLHLIGRKKEMLKVRGMSVFPSEVEKFISQHEAIELCAVVGKPDSKKGEVPLAFVKLYADYVGHLNENDLEEWCREIIAGYKVPQFRIIADLPMTATGKVKKEELKKLVQMGE